MARRLYRRKLMSYILEDQDANHARCGFLYAIGAGLFAFGFTALFAPHIINEQLQLMPSSVANISETRGLYGGGFIGFSLLIFLGLCCKNFARGLLLAVAIIMACIVVGRLVSLGIDRDCATTVPAIIGELIIALACWWESKGKVAPYRYKQLIYAP